MQFLEFVISTCHYIDDEDAVVLWFFLLIWYFRFLFLSCLYFILFGQTSDSKKKKKKHFFLYTLSKTIHQGEIYEEIDVLCFLHVTWFDRRW